MSDCFHTDQPNGPMDRKLSFERTRETPRRHVHMVRWGTYPHTGTVFARDGCSATHTALELLQSSDTFAASNQIPSNCASKATTMKHQANHSPHDQ